MKPLPSAETYERELKYMPYHKSLDLVELIVVDGREGDKILDLMCGTGYLLGKIAKYRPDLKLTGVDIDERYIRYAKGEHPEVHFEVGDVLTWKSKHKYDIVMCTGALHHIPYEKQEEVIKRISKLVRKDGEVVISDCYVDDYLDETQRKVAAAKLGYEYLKATIRNGAPNDVVEATADILHNDVMMAEFKTSLEKRIPIFHKFFTDVHNLKTWPMHLSEYGDYVTVLRGVK
jgi:2-polyprenyl-3-methyl-5-hydroxy-6-metoxy-1,4-benzoquinol methylase